MFLIYLLIAVISSALTYLFLRLNSNSSIHSKRNADDLNPKNATTLQTRNKMPKFCSFCGAKFENPNAKFCTSCGKGVDAAPAKAAPQKESRSNSDYSSNSSSSFSSSTSSSSSSGEKSGWLFKPTGLLARWKQRWCVVGANAFYCYKFQGDPTPESTASLRSATVDPAPYTGKEYSFHIDASGTHLYLQALSESDMNDWTSALTRAGAKKIDTQWPGGVKRDVGRLEKPPALENKAPKTSSSSSSSGGWASSNNLSVPETRARKNSDPKPPPKAWGGGGDSSSKSSSSSSSTKAWGSSGGSGVKAWGGSSSANTPANAETAAKSWGGNGGSGVLSKSWGSSNTSNSSNNQSSSSPAPNFKKPVVESPSDFKPNIVLKTEGADGSISLPTNVVKQSKLNYEDFGPDYKWQSMTASGKPPKPPKPRAPSPNSFHTWGNNSTTSSSPSSSSSSSSSKASSKPAWGGSTSQSSDPPSVGREISAPQLVSKPNPIVAKKRFNLDPLDTSKPSSKPSSSPVNESSSPASSSSKKSQQNEEPPLPPDWAEAFTDQGDPYYYNIYTNETTWDRPTAGGGGGSEVTCSGCGKVWPSGVVFCGDCGNQMS